jgi:hypothetical protein
MRIVVSQKSKKRCPKMKRLAALIAGKGCAGAAKDTTCTLSFAGINLANGDVILFFLCTGETNTLLMELDRDGKSVFDFRTASSPIFLLATRNTTTGPIV